MSESAEISRVGLPIPYLQMKLLLYFKSILTKSKLFNDDFYFKIL